MKKEYVLATMVCIFWFIMGYFCNHKVSQKNQEIRFFGPDSNETATVRYYYINEANDVFEFIQLDDMAMMPFDVMGIAK